MQFRKPVAMVALSTPVLHILLTIMMCKYPCPSSPVLRILTLILSPSEPLPVEILAAFSSLFAIPAILLDTSSSTISSSSHFFIAPIAPIAPILVLLVLLIPGGVVTLPPCFPECGGRQHAERGKDGRTRRGGEREKCGQERSSRQGRKTDGRRCAGGMPYIARGKGRCLNSRDPNLLCHQRMRWTNC
eukprot:763929-Hanusia_phi.AAC.10